ncbi:hypothetical protein ACFL2Q_04010 [Thermodesulfobacteriota bacterium]
MIVGVALGMILGVVEVGANGGPVPRAFSELMTHGGRYFLIRFVLPIFCITVIVEYIVIYRFLYRSLKSRLKLFIWVLLVNLITNPVTQAFWFSVAVPTNWGSDSDALYLVNQLIVEFVVVLVEFPLLWWVFRRMHRRGAIEEPVPAKRTLLISFVTNMVSYLFVFIAAMAFLTFSPYPRW